MRRISQQFTAYLLLATFAPVMLLGGGLHLLPGFDHCHGHAEVAAPCGHVCGNDTEHAPLHDGTAIDGVDSENCAVCTFLLLCQSNTLPVLPQIEFNTADDFVSLPAAFDVLQIILSTHSRAPPVLSLV
jgi:hypothetical protein